MTLKLVLGSRNYSSWSMRPWFAMKLGGVPFEEEVLPIYMPGSREAILHYSPSGKVPVLIDNGVCVWESLAIIEYVAERFPNAGLWPREVAARAHARAIANEMHGGFLPLRRSCPMNLRRPRGAVDLSDEVRANVERIDALWRDCRIRYEGPFLFGPFCGADAMFAPVVSRFHSYQIDVSALSQHYMATVMGLPEWSIWANEAAKETWVLPQFEIPITVR